MFFPKRNKTKVEVIVKVHKRSPKLNLKLTMNLKAAQKIVFILLRMRNMRKLNLKESIKKKMWKRKRRSKLIIITQKKR